MIAFIILTIFIAWIFDFINGFHDAANSIATVVSTKVLKPHQAVVWAAFFNFVAMFIFAPHVADTISKIVRIEAHQSTYLLVVFSGLMGAIIWNLITWYLGLPTSSSHALIGGISGAGVAFAGWGVINMDKLTAALIFIVIAPFLGFILGFTFMLALSWLFRAKPPFLIDHWFRRGQLVSAALYSIGHGANDAQKTMGVLVALLVAAGLLSPERELSLYHLDTAWIILSCQLMMALGTAIGGWRIVKTMGMKITKLKPVGGFSAETSGALTLFLATYFGIPVSTTQTISGAIMGVGTCNPNGSAVNWNIAIRIFWTWVLTVPLSAAFAALLFFILKNWY